MNLLNLIEVQTRQAAVKPIKRSRLNLFAEQRIDIRCIRAGQCQFRNRSKGTVRKQKFSPADFSCGSKSLGMQL
jgi:hypothetical protein